MLVFIDLLFLPRLLFLFGIPMSLFIVIAKAQFSRRGVIYLLVLGATMSVSVVYGAISGINAVPIESLKRVLQFISILSFAFYRIDLSDIAPLLIKVFRAFYIWGFCAMLVFFFDPGLYEKVVTAIYPETLDQLENALFTLRFAYFFADPNSAGYFICFTLVAYLLIERSRLWAFFCATLATTTVIATQSRGAYVALLMIFLSLTYAARASRMTKLRVVFFAGLLVGALFFFYGEDISQAYAVFDARFEQEDDFGGGRSDKYAYFLQNLNLLPFGPGYDLQREGAEFRPHSDLIRLNLSYGVMALPIMLYFVFPRRRSQLLLFGVFLIPFLINTVIDDYRLFPMYLLLFGLCAQLDTFRAGLRQRTALYARRSPGRLAL